MGGWDLLSSDFAVGGDGEELIASLSSSPPP